MQSGYSRSSKRARMKEVDPRDMLLSKLKRKILKNGRTRKRSGSMIVRTKQKSILDLFHDENEKKFRKKKNISFFVPDMNPSPFNDEEPKNSRSILHRKKKKGVKGKQLRGIYMKNFFNDAFQEEPETRGDDRATDQIKKENERLKFKVKLLEKEKEDYERKLNILIMDNLRYKEKENSMVGGGSIGKLPEISSSSVGKVHSRKQTGSDNVKLTIEKLKYDKRTLIGENELHKKRILEMEAILNKQKSENGMLMNKVELQKKELESEKKKIKEFRKSYSKFKKNNEWAFKISQNGEEEESV